MPHKIAEFASGPARTIPPDVSLSVALRAMRASRVRHLIVVEHSRPIGVLTLHDVHFAEAEGRDPDATMTRAAMEPALVVSPEATLTQVVARMLASKSSAAVVQRGSDLAIFTTTDALAALARLLLSPLPGQHVLVPSTIPPG